MKSVISPEINAGKIFLFLILFHFQSLNLGQLAVDPSTDVQNGSIYYNSQY